VELALPSNPRIAAQRDLGGERIDALACRRARPTAGQENRPLSDGRFSVFSAEKALNRRLSAFEARDKGLRNSSRAARELL